LLIFRGIAPDRLARQGPQAEELVFAPASRFMQERFDGSGDGIPSSARASPVLPFLLKGLRHRLLVDVPYRFVKEVQVLRQM
jgi:hypothetical protein